MKGVAGLILMILLASMLAIGVAFIGGMAAHPLYEIAKSGWELAS